MDYAHKKNILWVPKFFEIKKTIYNTLKTHETH